MTVQCITFSTEQTSIPAEQNPVIYTGISLLAVAVPVIAVSFISKQILSK